MKFIVCRGGSNGVSFSEYEAESAEALKQEIEEDNEGCTTRFINSIEKFNNSEYWPEGSYLIIQGKVV